MIEDIYFQMHCLYNAKTELYDRSLTDMREKYDPTSAYVGISNDVRNRSNIYARNLYQWYKRQIEYETGRPFDFIQWNEVISKYENMPSQGWIDLYNNFLGESMINKDNSRKE